MRHIAVVFLGVIFSVFYSFLFVHICTGIPARTVNKKRDIKSKWRQKRDFNSNQTIESLGIPQLTKKDKKYLQKIEDALTSRKGKIVFTNDWAVQLDPAEIAAADRIAKKHGFHNLGQVGH